MAFSSNRQIDKWIDSSLSLETWHFLLLCCQYEALQKPRKKRKQGAHNIAGSSNSWKHSWAKCPYYIARIITVLGAINSNLTFIFDLNYFLWKLKTLKRQGVSSLLETKHKVFQNETNSLNASAKTLKVASKFLSPTLNLQSHWQPVGRNFRAPKNMGGLCFQVLRNSECSLCIIKRKRQLQHTQKNLTKHSSCRMIPLSQKKARILPNFVTFCWMPGNVVRIVCSYASVNLAGQLSVVYFARIGRS